MENKFKNANEAFKYYKWQIPEYGVDFDDTKALFNIGFYIENPMDNLIEDQNLVEDNINLQLENEKEVTDDSAIHKTEIEVTEENINSEDNNETKNNIKDDINELTDDTDDKDLQNL